MRLNLIATFITTLAASAVADFKFLQPNSQFYAVANATTTITWDYSGDVPQAISIRLSNKTPSNTTFVGEQGIVASVPVSNKKYDWAVPASQPIGDNWILNAYPVVAADNSTTPPSLGVSDAFSIKPAGTEPPKDTTSTSPSSPSSTSSPSSSNSTSNGGDNKSAGTRESAVKSLSFVVGIIGITLLNNLF
ncbi:6914_t:CDS:2 [Paraglomus occultum]|uniref:6914_t:CDS:1 n=1 Tax=Paraglomus occultum TaxID=144539 RepID=A0A9N8ZW30_9GLOM|nr:6914_t:CDS:2 [Paraglomus occultum]